MSVNKVIRITFDEDILAGPNVGGILLKQGISALNYSYAISENVLAITPEEPLATDTKYQVLVPDGAVQDVDGNGGEGCKILFNSLETEAPVIKGTYPVDQGLNIPTNKDILIKFNEQIVPGDAFGEITVKAGALDVFVEKRIEKNALILDPNQDLDYNTVYTVTVLAGAIKDPAGNALTEGITFSFTARSDRDKPYVAESNVENKAINIPVNQSFLIKLNETVKVGPNFSKVVLKTGMVLEEFDYTISGDVLTITPKNPLQFNARYQLLIPARALEDTAGNYSKSFRISFATVQNSVTPAITSSNPSEGAESVAVDENLMITFNSNVSKGVNFKYISLQDTATLTQVFFTANVADNVVTIEPRTAMVSGTEYQLYIPSGAFMDGGNNPSNCYSVRFTTV